jgi:alkylation response protein AidB-like acyl-CoA dehydrogenase
MRLMSGSIDYPSTVRGSRLLALDPDARSLLAHLNSQAWQDWQAHLFDFGDWVAGAVDEEAEYTDRHARPKLATYDGDGNLANHIIYNPAWEAASSEVYARGIVGLNYGEAPAPFLTTFAMGYMLSQANVSLHCPVTMTGAVAYVLDRFAPEDIKETFLPSLIRRDGKALSGGTWATELHGGSDIGGTTTSASPVDGDPGLFRLNGLKWFTSNANGGLALATARPDDGIEGTKGLGVYLVPTHLEDGTPNHMRIRRLKDKMGTCGVATGEIDLVDTLAWEVAGPPRGFKLMMAALEFSRIHNAMSAVGVARRAYLEAVIFAENREAFGHTITDYPMVQAEIMKILAPQVAGMYLTFNAAKAFDDASNIDVEDTDNPARVWLRVLTALAKYWTAEMCVRAASRAIEVIGGNGYVYDRITPRLLRDGQVLSVWEGPANIQALEMLRLLDPRFGGFQLFEDEVERLLANTADASKAAGTDIAAPVRELFAHCREAVGHMAATPELASRHARRLLALMSDVLAAAYMLNVAATEAKADSRRMALVTRFLVEECLTNNQGWRIVYNPDWLSPHFGSIIRHHSIN